MPAAPYALLRVAVNAGAPTTGGIIVPASASLQLSAESTVAWYAQRWECYSYPPGFAAPAGWTLDPTTLVLYSLAVTPPVFPLPAIAFFGKWLFRLKVNEGISGSANGNLTDESTAVSMLSANGVEDIAAHETTQFSATEGWAAALKANVRTLASGVAVPSAASITYAGSGNWADATAVTASTVEGAIDEVVSDLASVSGASKIGANIAASLAGPNAIVGTNVDDVFENLVQQLATAAATDGATRIGAASTAQSPTSLAIGSVRSQLTELLTAVNARARLASTETITGAWTVDNVTASGVTEYKLASRSVTWQLAPKAQLDSSDTAWDADSNALTQSTSSTGEITFSLDLPNGAVITSVSVWLDPAAGHSATPTTMPRLKFGSLVPSTATFTTIGTVIDTYGSAGAYEAIHKLSLTGLSTTVNVATTHYWALVRGEAGSGGTTFQAGFRILGFEITATLTKMSQYAA